MGDSLPSFLFFNLATNLLWFFGLHGGNIIGSITNPIYTPLALENFALYEAGQAPTHIISGSFGKCFTSGGVGSMFSLAIIMVLFAKSEQFKTLGKLALPTTMFFIIWYSNCFKSNVLYSAFINNTNFRVFNLFCNENRLYSNS